MILAEARAKVFLHKRTNWTEWQKTLQKLKSGPQLGRRNGTSEDKRKLIVTA